MPVGNEFTSFNSYLIKAAEAWIRDNGLTPMLVIDALYPDTNVPIAYVKDGLITLSVAYNSVGYFRAEENGFAMSARFNRVSIDMFIPYEAIRVIYARESQTNFAVSLPVTEPRVVQQLDNCEIKVVDDEAPTLTTPRRKGHLTLVK